METGEIVTIATIIFGVLAILFGIFAILWQMNVQGNRLDAEIKATNAKIETEIRAVNAKIETEIRAVNAKIETEIKGLKDSLESRLDMDARLRVVELEQALAAAVRDSERRPRSSEGTAGY